MHECININEHDFNRSEYILEFIEKIKDYLIMDNNFKNKLREYDKEYIRQIICGAIWLKGFLMILAEQLQVKQIM